ncbi:MFS transporter [Burkholderia sp. FL-7-2-10-S1-D7]|uniref:MFS transporter n=1 Tax=Burkholderia sp. FL-7-2-10-S1-D7 TaxID=1637866 RepID=UPI00075F3E84|nr:MFS transporter [Burkholderia sp. FL-7-2-10-S1-D7]KVF79605.1 MFS transporter [Burkholderia sp. FL-7-2-10-S1-D7]
MDTTTRSPTFPPGLARIVATVSIGFVVTQLDVTIVNIALAHLAGDLHLPVAGLQWVVDAYTLAFAVLMLSGGALGDRFGARRMYVVGLVLFALASLACGAAVSPAMLIAARALQGVGAAAMLPNSLALLNDACRHDPPLRARAVGWWTAAGSISIAAGPVVGGLLIAAWGWRGIFLVNLPLCAAGLAATFAWVPARHIGAASKQPTTPVRAVQALDLRGQLIAIAMLTALTAAVIEWQPLGFSHPVVAGGFALAALAGLAFVAVESHTATPMLPLSLFRRRTFSAAVLFGICVNLTYYGTVFVLALYLQRVRGESAWQAGLAFLPLTGGFLLSNLASGRAVARHGPRAPMLAGALVAALGYGALHFIDASTPLPLLLVPFLLIPTGMGFAVPAMTTAVLASVEHECAGIASAVLNTARQTGGAMGVAAFGAVAGSGAAWQTVEGLHVETGVSAGLLVTAALLATLVRPDAHRGASGARRAASAAD